MDRGFRRHGEERQGTNRAQAPTAETLAQASTTTQTQGASTCEPSALLCARSGPGLGVSGQSQPRTLGEPEGESGSRSLHPGLSRPATLKFPTDWRSQCYSGTRRQRRRAGNGEDRACSPPRTREGGHKSNSPTSQHSALITLPRFSLHTFRLRKPLPPARERLFKYLQPALRTVA